MGQMVFINYMELRKHKILKISLVTFVLGLVLNSSNINAGYELACEGYPPPNSGHKLLSIDCNNRKIFIGMLKDSWLSLRRGGIGGTLENLCYEAYTDAKELHPSISFLSVSESFLMRCNMGLAYLQD
jgi:hypothetical protein